MHTLIVSNHWGVSARTNFGGSFVDRQIEALRGAGLRVSTFDVGSSHSPIHLFSRFRELRRLIKELKPDVIHARYGTIVAALSVAAGKPAVITFCGSDLLPGASVSRTRTHIGIFLSRVAALFSAANICVSEELRNSLWRRSAEVHLIPDGVDLDLFSPGSRNDARRHLGWNESAPIVLFNAARDLENKGHDLGLESMDLVKKVLPEAELRVPRSVPLEEMVHHYRAADVLLVASRQEGSPNVVKEALACNLPVVSTAVGDVSVRLRGVSPSAVVDREPGAIADALVDVLRLGTRCNGREHVELLSQRETAMRVIEVYRRVTSGTASTRNRQTAWPVQPQTVSLMSEGDLPEVIAVHRNAFQGYMNTSLGDWYLRRFLGWFVATENAIALVARDNNSECSGYVVGAPIGYESQLNRQLLVPAAFGLVSHPWGVLERRVQRAVVARLTPLLAKKRRFSDPNSSLPRPTISLVGIGVTAKAQGTGTGSRLMEAFQDEARSMGMCSMRLSVYPDNIAARRLYEKNGWMPLTNSESPRAAMYYAKIMSPAA